MSIQFHRIVADKKQYLDLLLLGDAQESMIDRYLDKGHMVILDDNGVKCAAVVLELSDTECELKNIATYPQEQGKGYGQAMIRYLLETFLGQFDTMYVGTGETPKTIQFYEKCGFQYSHRVRNFFIENYSHPIIDDGVRLVDMVYFKQGKLTLP